MILESWMEKREKMVFVYCSLFLINLRLSLRTESGSFLLYLFIFCFNLLRLIRKLLVTRRNELSNI